MQCLASPLLVQNQAGLTSKDTNTAVVESNAEFPATQQHDAGIA